MREKALTVTVYCRMVCGMATKHIEVVAGRTQTDVCNGQAEIGYEFDTIAEAKKRAKHYLTDDFMHLIEASEPMRYAQVRVNGECVYDYFRKGYNGEQTEA